MQVRANFYLIGSPAIGLAHAGWKGTLADWGQDFIENSRSIWKSLDKCLVVLDRARILLL